MRHLPQDHRLLIRYPKNTKESLTLRKGIIIQAAIQTFPLSLIFKVAILMIKDPKMDTNLVCRDTTQLIIIITIKRSKECRQPLNPNQA
jgi:hypothetical protein